MIRGATCALALALLLPPAGAHAGKVQRVRGAALAVSGASGWRTWWREHAAPARWAAPDPAVTSALHWRSLADGVEWASLRLAGAAPAWRTRLIVARFDPRRVRTSLEMALSADGESPGWTLDRAPSDALLAVNAGQFVETMPWGWVVIDGRQRLEPGYGPLSCAVAFDTAGAVHWLAAESLGVIVPGVAAVFQSYPVLLEGDGAVPLALREDGRGVHRRHRDARLALGEARDGRLLVVMTRFDALGEGVGALPFGPTTPEMAAILGALGARRAVLLDGGISAQLLLREPRTGRSWSWRGWRKVPLALIVRPRAVTR